MKPIKLFLTVQKVMAKAWKQSQKYPDNFMSVFRPSLPDTLNLMVNDICNSRCKMCNVWKQKQEKEITPAELEKTLKDPLFKKLNYIGVSGGEPTLRKNLPEFFRVIAQKKGIKGAGIITNALQADQVIRQTEACYKICKERSVAFSVMVSLDGIGKTHDLVRGRDGGFLSACNVIRHLRDNTDIAVSIGCTVIRENVWHLDEVLDFCRAEKVNGRFRIAEFINRLYNDDLKDAIRNFNIEEQYQIALFFFKLEKTYEKNPCVKETYKNIRRMIFEAKHRQSGCPYRSKAVGFDSKGNLLFCSPKSPVMESCLTDSAKKIYLKNLPVRTYITENYCCNCIHDYHAPPGKNSRNEKQEEEHYQNKFSVYRALKVSIDAPSAKPLSPDWSTFDKPLITGWYGTETVGDKAILCNIIERLKKANPKAQISISSIYPFVTNRTLHELGMENIKIIKTYSKQFLPACKNADAVIMGGGPLMNMEPLGFVLQAFSTAARAGTPTIIEGCGMGPLIDEKYINAAGEILRLSNQISVRDKASLDWIGEKTERKDARYIEDPAAGFVKAWKQNNKAFQKPADNKYFTCFLRELTTEYSHGMTTSEFNTFRISFENNLGEMIVAVTKKTGLKPFLLPMHTFVIGRDDRDFARRFANTFLSGCDYKIGDRLYSPGDILTIMQKSQLNICMRFHSVLFAETLDIPYIAIDYTGGGKIWGFLCDKHKEDLMINRLHLSQNNWQETVDNILKKYSLMKCL